MLALPVQPVKSVSNPVLVSFSVVGMVICPAVEVVTFVPLCPVQSVSLQGELAASTILGRMGERIPKRKTKSKRTDIIFLTLTIYQIIKLLCYTLAMDKPLEILERVLKFLLY